jgi:hypothetical protein
MTTNSKISARIKGMPAKAGRARYGDDLYGWVQDQVKLLQANETGSIDAFHLTQELTDLGRSEFDKLVSALRVVLLHLLKWDFQPERRSRSWAVTVREQRRRIDRLVRENPSFKPRISEAIDLAYGDARDEAFRETGLSESVFPDVCRYGWDDITLHAIAWDDEPPLRQR